MGLQLTVCFMALTHKIFYTSIFPLKDFQTQMRRERERERERERARRETRESEIGLVPLSSDHRPKPRRVVELALRDHAGEIVLSRSHLSRCIVRLSYCPLDRTLFVSISVQPEAYCRWIGLVAYDPPMTDLSLSRSTFPFPSICNHSLFLLPLSV